MKLLKPKDPFETTRDRVNQKRAEIGALTGRTSRPVLLASAGMIQDYESPEIGGVLDDIGEWFEDAFDAIGQWFEDAWNWLQDVWEEIKRVLADIKDWLVDGPLLHICAAIASLIPGVGPAIAGAIEVAYACLAGACHWAEAAVDAVDAAIDTVNTTAEAVNGAGVELAGGLLGSVMGERARNVLAGNVPQEYLRRDMTPAQVLLAESDWADDIEVSEAIQLVAWVQRGDYAQAMGNVLVPVWQRQVQNENLETWVRSSAAQRLVQVALQKRILEVADRDALDMTAAELANDSRIPPEIVQCSVLLNHAIDVSRFDLDDLERAHETAREHLDGTRRGLASFLHSTRQQLQASREEVVTPETFLAYLTTIGRWFAGEGELSEDLEAVLLSYGYRTRKVWDDGTVTYGKDSAAAAHVLHGPQPVRSATVQQRGPSGSKVQHGPEPVKKGVSVKETYPDYWNRLYKDWRDLPDGRPGWAGSAPDSRWKSGFNDDLIKAHVNAWRAMKRGDTRSAAYWLGYSSPLIGNYKKNFTDVNWDLALARLKAMDRNIAKRTKTVDVWSGIDYGKPIVPQSGVDPKTASTSAPRKVRGTLVLPHSGVIDEGVYEYAGPGDTVVVSKSGAADRGGWQKVSEA